MPEEKRRESDIFECLDTGWAWLGTAAPHHHSSAPPHTYHFGLPIMLKVEDMKVLDIGMKLCVPCFRMPQQKGRVVRTHTNSRCA